MTEEGHETRTYAITGKPEQLDILERVFGNMEALGAVGSSRHIDMFVDGDGAVRLKFRKDGERLLTEDIRVGSGFLVTSPNGNIKVYLG